jgi:4-carboxymuconolactone decarboxylase
LLLTAFYAYVTPRDNNGTDTLRCHAQWHAIGANEVVSARNGPSRGRYVCGPADDAATPGESKIMPFLDEDNELFKVGVAIRRDVVGSAYVDKSLAAADAFSGPFQQLVTEYCWGAVWGRDGLDRATRSRLNIAMLAVLNRGAELKLHIQGALRNGVTKDEVREILMQVAIYAGVPAGVEGFRIAKEAITEYEAMAA